MLCHWLCVSPMPWFIKVHSAHLTPLGKAHRLVHVSQCVCLFDGSQYNQLVCCPGSGRAHIEFSFFFSSVEPDIGLDLLWQDTGFNLYHTEKALHMYFHVCLFEWNYMFCFPVQGFLPSQSCLTLITDEKYSLTLEYKWCFPCRQPDVFTWPLLRLYQSINVSGLHCAVIYR